MNSVFGMEMVVTFFIITSWLIIKLERNKIRDFGSTKWKDIAWEYRQSRPVLYCLAIAEFIAFMYYADIVYALLS